MKNEQEILKNNQISEKEKKPDFQKIFFERLDKIEPIQEGWRRDASAGLKKIGIELLKKKVPALLIRMPGGQDLDVWIEDPRNLSLLTGYLHDEVREKLVEFLNLENEYDKNYPRYPIAGSIIEDEKSELYLLLDRIRSKGTKSMMENEDWSKPLLDLLRKYKIKKVIGDMDINNPANSNIIIDEDLIGKRREEMFFVNFAQKYKMTNTQFLRFRGIVQSSFEAGYPIKWDDVAKEIIQDDKNL